MAHAPALHSCPTAARLGFPTGSPTQVLRLLSKPGLGGTASPTTQHPSIGFPLCKAGEDKIIPSHPILPHLQGQHSLLQPVLLAAQGAAMACAAPRAALAWAAQAQLELRLLCLAPGGVSRGRTIAAGSPNCPGTGGMLRGTHGFPHLHPELSHTTHLSKPLLSANNKSQPRGGTGSPEREGCWHPRACCPGRSPALAPSPAPWAAAGLGVHRGDG